MACDVSPVAMFSYPAKADAHLRLSTSFASLATEQWDQKPNLTSPNLEKINMWSKSGLALLCSE